MHDLDVEGDRVRCEVETDKLDGLLKALTVPGAHAGGMFLRHYAGDGPERAGGRGTGGSAGMNTLAGAGLADEVGLRRDRIMLVIWIYAFAAFAGAACVTGSRRCT